MSESLEGRIEGCLGAAASVRLYILASVTKHIFHLSQTIHEEHEKQQYCVKFVLFGNGVFQPALCQSMLEASYLRTGVCL